MSIRTVKFNKESSALINRQREVIKILSRRLMSAIDGGTPHGEIDPQSTSILISRNIIISAAVVYGIVHIVFEDYTSDIPPRRAVSTRTPRAAASDTAR
ncbi:hypothetical protein EVAR_35783_1 [Eumeta japonica]|uniref:Uncharacterized protein n=1 Tax=Eumeta variegata TaxID=151549 RepID=A0A4C1WR52_EUMVA|nr:hypothetical protein EVAR_35783_1 [Eumeta japonica]